MLRRIQSLLGSGRRKALTMSGSPANFWPVWFQLRAIRRAVRATVGHHNEESCPVLYLEY